MSPDQTTFSGDSFKLGYRFQSYWDFHMATAFFFGELGAGLFLVSLYFGFVPGMVAGLLCTGVGKPYYHMSHMGVPMKSQFVAVAASLLVMTYQGFAMSHSSAIALWNSGLMPVASLVYALTSGAAVTMALNLFFNGIDPLLISKVVIALVTVTLLVLLSLLHATYHGTVGARQSLELLTRGQFAKPFLSLVFGAGVVLPILALWFFGASTIIGLIAAVGVVAGFYAFRLLIFKAGVFEPQISFAARFGLS